MQAFKPQDPFHTAPGLRTALRASESQRGPPARGPAEELGKRPDRGQDGGEDAPEAPRQPQEAPVRVFKPPGGSQAAGERKPALRASESKKGKQPARGESEKAGLPGEPPGRREKKCARRPGEEG